MILLKHTFSNSFSCGLLRRLSSVSFVAMLCVFTGLAANEIAPLSADSLPTSYGYPSYSSSDKNESSDWWKIFGDDALTRLEALVQKNNYSAKAAFLRIEAARALVKQARSGFYPSVDLAAGYTISRPSGKEARPYSSTPTSSWFQVGASMSWEIDILGRLAQKVKAQKDALEISRLEFEGVQLSLAAEVASDYFTLRMYKAQLATAVERLKSQEEVLAIVEARYKAGLVSKLDVAQAKSMVSNTRLLIPSLEAETTTATNAIALLCGVSDSDISRLVAQSGDSRYDFSFATGVPADLLRRRPDVQEAEMSIRSMADDLGIARKDYLPALSLNASIGTSAHNVKNLFGKNSLYYEVAPSLSWTLFDGFSRSARVAEAKAQMEAQIEEYNNTLSTAVSEVKNSLASYSSVLSQARMYDDILVNDEEMVALSLERYRHGLADFSDVADAQVTWMSDANSYDQARAACLTSLVAIFKSLGGSYSPQ